jgi:heme/copper-type cytochrome/quinol oxidase subunit 2
VGKIQPALWDFRTGADMSTVTFNVGQLRGQNVKVIEVSAKKHEFNPSAIHIKQGTKVQLRITATDHTHGFKIGAFSDGSDKSGSVGLAFTSPQDCWKIEKGQSSTIEFVAQTAGTYSSHRSSAPDTRTLCPGCVPLPAHGKCLLLSRRKTAALSRPAA